MGTSTGAYYLRLYRHPLVVQLSDAPALLSQLPMAQLQQAQRLLRHSGRLAAVLGSSPVQPSWLDQALSFTRTTDPALRSGLLATRLRATYTPLASAPLALYTLRLGEEFMLNVEYVLLVLPPATLAAEEVLDQLQPTEESHYNP